MIQYFQFIERIIENKKIKKYLIFVLYGLVKKGRLVYNLIHVLFRKKYILQKKKFNCNISMYSTYILNHGPPEPMVFDRRVSKLWAILATILVPSVKTTGSGDHWHKGTPVCGEKSFFPLHSSSFQRKYYHRMFSLWSFYIYFHLVWTVFI